MLACVGDLHCDKLTHLVPNFTERVLNSLVATLKPLILRGCSHVILLGDIFDSPYPDQEAIIALVETLTNLGARFYIIPGNHDYADVKRHSLKVTKWIGSLPKGNIRVIEEPTMLRIEGYRYYVCPHPFVEPMPTRADFAIGHFAVNGAKSDNGFKVRSKHAPKGNWILGDFHTRQVGRVSSCKYEYAGSLTQLSWFESPKKSVILIDDGEKHRVPTRSTYSLVKKVVESEEDLVGFDEPDTFYYVQTKGKFVLPKGWGLDHPQVVRTSTVTRKSDKRAVALLEQAKLTTQPLQHLETFLRARKLDGDIVARAVEIAEGIKI